MAERLTYAVILPDKRWGRTSTLASAKAAIDKAKGGKIYSYPLRNGGNDSWDAPTVRATWDVVPYSPKPIKRKATKRPVTKTATRRHKTRK